MCGASLEMSSGNSSALDRVLSVLLGAHSIGKGIIGKLTEKEKKKIRLASSAFKEAVNVSEEFGYKHKPIKTSLEVWKRKFPKAKYANISRRKDLTDANFVHLENLEYLDMGYCNQSKFTDAALTHLKNIHTLIIRGCTQITDDAFKPLNKLTTLDISYCTQLSTKAFVHFKNIKKLTMNEWDKNKIYSDGFQNLENIEDLSMAFCQSRERIVENEGITNAVFNNLPNPDKLKKLDISYCVYLTDDIFTKITNLLELNMMGCDKLTDTAFTHFKNIKILNMKNCSELTIEGINLTREKIPNLVLLNVKGCNPPTLKKAFENFGVTTEDPIVKPQAGGYTRRSKVRRHSTRRKSN